MGGAWPGFRGEARKGQGSALCCPPRLRPMTARKSARFRPPAWQFWRWRAPACPHICNSLIKRSIKSGAHQTELQGPCSGCFSKNSFHVHPMRPCRPLFAICCPPGRPPPPPARRLLHSYSSTVPNYNCFLHSYSSTGPMHNCFLHSYSLTARTIIAFCIPILKQVPAIIVSAFLFFNRSQL